MPQINYPVTSPYIRNGGRIINTSTGFTRVAAPMQSIYAASKGALETLTLALAPHVASKGVTINAVRPGITATNKEMRSTSEGLAQAAALSAFNRVGTTEDVADVVAFLASEEARWITGQFIDVTGGSRL